MTKQYKILHPFTKFIFMGFLFCFFASFEGWAQEESREAITGSTLGNDPINGLEESALETENKKSEVRNGNNFAVQPKEKGEEHLPKEGGERESNKEGMSTLSFNLFLYVVDKFKEK